MDLILAVLFLTAPHFVFASTDQNSIGNTTSQNQTRVLKTLVEFGKLFEGLTVIQYLLLSAIVIGIIMCMIAMCYACYKCHQMRYRRHSYERLSDIN
jgi:hypothetical protein